MSHAPNGRAEALPAELRAALEATLRFQQDAGTTLLYFAIGVAVAITAFATQLGMHPDRIAPTQVPAYLAAALGVVGIVLAVVHRRRRTKSLRAALAAGQVTVVEGRLGTSEILPAVGTIAGRPRAYSVDGTTHVVLEETPGSDALLGFVPHEVVGPVGSTPVRLVFSAVQPGHLLQVDYPGLGAAPETVTAMTSQDWKALMARPRVLLRTAGWCCAAVLLGLLVLAFLPGVSRGFSTWLACALVVLPLWTLWLCLPYLRLWGRRGQVQCETVHGPIQEVMRAQRNRGQQAAEQATFVRVGGRWHRLQAGEVHTLRPGAVLGDAHALAYATLGTHRVALGRGLATAALR